MEDIEQSFGKLADGAPCPCGSALPAVLCCGGRAVLGALGQPVTFRSREQQDWVVARWDLAISTMQALTSVLPHVPVPLLGNREPRELYAVGPEERSAVLTYLNAVAQTAETIGLDFPITEMAELLDSSASACLSLEQRQYIALATFTLQMLARGFDAGAVLGAQRLFRDALRIVRPALRKPAVYAAGVDYAMCWMHFRPETSNQVAALYGVSASAVAKNFFTMKRELKLVWYDPRYAVQEPEWQQMLERTARALADGEDEAEPSSDE